MAKEKVECFETKDGKIFKSKKEASDYEAALDFQNWYSSKNSNYCLDSLDEEDGMVINWRILYNWLNKNKKEIINFLK